MGNADKVMRVRELEIAIRLYGEQIEGLEEMIPFADTHGARGRVRGLYWRNQAQKYRETVAEARTTIAAAQSELAALRADLHPFVPVCAGAAAFYLGLVSLAWPDAAGGLGRAWSIAAMTWGLALVAATVAHRSRSAPLDLGRPAG